MKIGRISGIAVLALAALAPLSFTQLVSTVLDFEGLVDSVAVTNQFPGATFTNSIILSSGVSLNEFEFPPRSGVNVVSDSTGPIRITFATPITTFSAWFTYAAAVKVTAFGAGGVQVAVANSLFANNEALSGDPGSAPNEKLTVTFAGGINSITLAGLAGGGSFAADDITVTPPLVAPAVVTPPVQSTLTITNALTLATIPLGSSLSSVLSASGGVPPYSWTGSQLPDGVTVSADGRISGAPSQPGAYRFLVNVTDRQNVSQGVFMNFSVFGVTTKLLPDAPAFTSYSQTLAAIGGVLPYTWSGTGFPAGMSINSTGVISGIPTSQQGAYRLLIQSRDANGLATSAVITLNVSPPPPLTIPATTLAAGTLGLRLTQTLSVAGGSPPYSWSLASGSLPSGVTLNASGILAGTPGVAGQFPFVARVTDSVRVSATVSLTLTIAPPGVTVSLASPLPVGFTGVDYPVQLATVSGGSAPYTFSLTSGTLPAGLSLGFDGTIAGIPTAAGSSTFSVGVTDAAGATGSASAQATIRAVAPGLALSAGTLNFALAPASAALPPPQSVQVFATTPGTQFTYSVKNDPAATWLAATPASGSTPGALTVSLTDPAALLAAAATPYQTTITVTCTAPAACAGSAQTVAVNLTVAASAPQLSIAEKSLSLVTSDATRSPVTQTITLQNSGGGSLGIASLVSGAPWLSLGPAPGFLSARQSATLQLTAQPASLPAGFSSTTITATTSAGSAVIPVSLFIAKAPVIALSPAGAQIAIQAGGAPSAAERSFAVTGDGTVRWNATVLPGAAWLSTSTASGIGPSGVAYKIDPTQAAALAAGTYYGTIRVTSPEAANSPLDFQVSLHIAAAIAAPSLTVAPEGLVFIGAAATPQTVSVIPTGANPTPWQASASTTDGKAWLSVSPATGTGAAQTNIAVNPAGLTPGTYYGTVGYAGPALALRTVNVTFILASAVDSCTPTRLVAAPVAPLGNFTALTLRPSPLGVRVLNDCGSTVTGALVSGTFTNGDSPVSLALADQTTGLYSGSWVPRQPTAQLQVSITASAPGFLPASLRLSGAALPGNSPSIAPRAVLHLFNPQPGGLTAPGALVQVYGQGFADATTAASSIPLPNTLGDTTVSIGGIQAPLFFVSPTQINAQVPFELTAGRQYEVVVNRNGALTIPEPIQVSDVAPGLATLAGGTLLAQHANGTLVNAAAPAKAGESLVAYATGLGKTDRPVDSGAGGPTFPLANPVIVPSLTIDGISALVQFSGLTPGLVGLYQINFQVPLSTQSGDLGLVLTQGDVSSNTTLLTVRN